MAVRLTGRVELFTISTAMHRLYACLFQANAAIFVTGANTIGHGGALYNAGGNSSITNCVFLSNTASRKLEFLWWCN